MRATLISWRGLTSLFPVIAIPARNEEKRLPLLIDALGEQTWLQRGDRRLDVVVVLDDCSDGSRGAAESAALRHPCLRLDLVEGDRRPEGSHVGAARRRAMDHALSLGRRAEDTVLITTDADAVPARDWVDANIAAIESGIHLVGGEIVGDRSEELLLGPGFRRRAELIARYAAAADRLESLIDPLPHDPWPRHRDHTGASLAVRGDVYRSVGGLPALPRREDLAFVSRVRRAGYLLQHPRSVKVNVSARLDGRAEGGMATCLRGWVQAEARGEPVLVEAPEAVARRAGRRARLRRLGDAASYAAAAAALGLDIAALRDAAGGYLSPAAAVETLAPDEPDAHKSVEADTALRQIAAMIDAFERACRVA